MTNVKIQIVSFSYPTDKILKTSNGFVIVSKKNWDIGWPTADGVGVWKADFFIRISMLQLGVGSRKEIRFRTGFKMKFYLEKSSKMKFALKCTGKTLLKTYILVIGRH